MPEQILKYLSEKLKPSRFEHVLSVRDQAIEIAKFYNANVKSIEIAALLHDCAKWMSKDQFLISAENYGIPIDPIELENPRLLHPKVGAAIAGDLFGIDDDEILHAISVHTTGSEKMGMTDKILFVADFCEPKRTHAEADPVRKLAFQNLDLATIEVLKNKIIWNLGKTVPIHPNTLDAYNSLVR